MYVHLLLEQVVPVNMSTEQGIRYAVLWVNRQKPLCLGDLDEILATLLCISNYSGTQHKYTPSLFLARVLVHYVAIVQVAVLMSHKVKNIHWTYCLRPVLRLNFAKYLCMQRQPSRKQSLSSLSYCCFIFSNYTHPKNDLTISFIFSKFNSFLDWSLFLKIRF